MTPEASDRNETATSAEIVSNASEKEVLAIIGPMSKRIARVAGVAARDALMGYEPHLATRDSGLPREIQDWIKGGCLP